MLRQIVERDIRLPLSYHQVDDYERLKDDSPGRVAQAILKRTEDLRDTGFSSMRCDEDVFDIFGFGRRKLQTVSRGLNKVSDCLPKPMSYAP